MFGKEKQADNDFLYTSLPETRGKQFGVLLRENFGYFVLNIGLTILIFSIPFLVALCIKYLGILPYASASMSEAEYKAFFNTNTLIFDGIYVPCFIIIALGLAGVARIYRKLAWGDGIFYMHDLFKGIKQNFLVYIIAAIIFSLLHFLSDLIAILNINVFLNYLPFAIEILVLPWIFIILAISSIYSKRFVSISANAFILYLKRPLYTLLFALFPLAISFIKYINLSFVQIIIYLVLFLVLIPIYILGFYLFCISNFDEYSNLYDYPEFYHKGLRDEFDPNRNNLIDQKKQKNDERNSI